MSQNVAPAIAQKFGEPGGLFDTVLQRLVSEWHRFQMDRDPERLAALGAILEAGLAQLRSFELLLGTEPKRAEGDALPESVIDATAVSHAGLDRRPAEAPGVPSVYAADPRAPREGESATNIVADVSLPSRLDDATHLLEALQAALQEALAPHRVASAPPPAATPGAVPAPPPAAMPAPPASGSARDPAVTREPQESPVASENGSGHDGHPFDRVFPRETFDVASTAELKRCRRFERSFSLLLLDLGKEADAQAGRILLSGLREFDLVGRYGDRVLAVGLPETAGENARIIAQRLVGLLAERGAWSELGRYGIATYPKDGNTLTTVVRTARSQLGAADSS